MRRIAKPATLIVVVALAAIVAIWALANRRIQREHDHAVAEAVKDSETLALAYEEYVERTIRNIDQALVFARQAYLREGARLDVGNLLRGEGVDTSVLQDLRIVDRDGGLLVGEIRDAETARIATQAAMTGHLVLTTLHTNDAIQASSRLIDMGVERFMVAPSLIGVMNQRLVRRNCEFCKTEYQADEAYLGRFFTWREGFAPPNLFRGEGCERCGGTGYRGRLGVFEVLELTNDIRELIGEKTDGLKIDQTAIRAGMTTMLDDGVAKCRAGLTSPAEILRVTIAR